MAYGVYITARSAAIAVRAELGPVSGHCGASRKYHRGHALAAQPEAKRFEKTIKR